jgi:hypothetical protein
MAALAVFMAATAQGAVALFRAGQATGYTRALGDTAQRHRQRADGAALCTSRVSFAKASFPGCSPASPLGSADGTVAEPTSSDREGAPGVRI